MKIVTAIQMVPDLVEDLVIDPDGNHLDPYSVRWVINELDDFAIEQAILLKERGGAKVSILAPNMEGADDALFAAAARGADELIKINAEFDAGVNSHSMARLFSPILKTLQADLVLTGVQTHDRSDGNIGPLLAEELGMPYIGYVSGITLVDGTGVVRKEYPGGLIAEMEVTLPAVIGVQSPDTPPRYISMSKIRQAMKTSKIQEQDSGDIDLSGAVPITKLAPPQVSNQVSMLAGSIDEIAAQLAAIFKDQGVI
jgi:electron transfer flavoprotein beta subunit